jgi:Uma2 family endonuclease
VVIGTKITHDDLLALPEDNLRREIIDGEMFVTPSPIADHQTILINLLSAFLDYLKAHRVGKVFVAPLDVILSDYDVLQPDLLFVLNERAGIVKDWVRGAPDLAVEILSPTTEKRDRGIKLKAYARFGVKEYWIIDPAAREVEVHRLRGGGYELAETFDINGSLISALLPGLKLDVASIFVI